MKTLRKYLILRATGEARVISRKPIELRLDEVAFEMRINIPDAWGRIQAQALTVSMPDEIPTVEVERTVQNDRSWSVGEAYMDHAGIHRT